MLDSARGPPERGDRMPAAGIAEQQVAGQAGGGAVHEFTVGTHGFRPTLRLERPSYSQQEQNRSRAWRYVLTQGVRALVRRDRR
jgi:hypothetical protein